MKAARRSDIVVVDKINKEKMIMDLAKPADTRVCEREKIARNTACHKRNCLIMANKKRPL